MIREKFRWGKGWVRWEKPQNARGFVGEGRRGVIRSAQQARQSLCDRVPCQDRAKPREAPKGTARMGRSHRAWERRRERPQAPQKSVGRRSMIQITENPEPIPCRGP